MKLTIGSLVLCYLLSPTINENNQNNQNEEQEPKIIKVWGKIVDFKERDALYDENRAMPMAYVQRVDDLIIKGINRKGIYQINVNACKPVTKLPKGADRPEPQELRMEKEKVDLEIDENYNVIEKEGPNNLSDEDQALKNEKIKKMVEERKKQDQQLKKEYEAEQKKQIKKESATEKEIPTEDIETPEAQEDKGVLDYLFEN